jgi:hypothetical protein
MFDRSHIEKLLHLNGVEPTAPEEEIKSVLISARWHKNDVETALLVLRENTQSHETHIDSLHKVFRSDDNLHPETISALLGIDVNIAKDALTQKKYAQKPQLSAPQALQICGVSFAIAIVFILASMWYLEMGVFHVTMR